MNFKQFKEKYQIAKVEEVPSQVTNSPLVSVLVQTYNHENYIRECLDSILVQKTDFEFEILLGEDFSADNTRQICREYAEKHPDKIRLFLHHPENKIKVNEVTTGNFNAFYNLYNSKGEYIAFCEGDDFWQDCNKLQLQTDFLNKNSQFILSYHKYEEKINSFPNGYRDQSYSRQPTHDLNKDDLSKLIFHPLLSTICFRNILKKFPQEMIEVINVDSFLLSLFGTFGKAKYQAEVQASIYRKHRGGIWSQEIKENKILAKIITFKNLMVYYQKKNNPELMDNFKTILFKNYKMLIHFYLKKRKVKQTGRIIFLMSQDWLRNKFK